MNREGTAEPTVCTACGDYECLSNWPGDYCGRKPNQLRGAEAPAKPSGPRPQRSTKNG